tara:strand:- start:27704 stop:28600 length:897 start_codon:yes stop_codon:yes gene_type:complete
MRLEDFELAPPGLGQVSVDVKAASVNPLDWKVRNGVLKRLAGRLLPRGMGRDFSGVVAIIGEGVTRLKPGDAVVGMLDLRDMSGSFANAVVVDEYLVELKPPALSHEIAACLPTVGTAAWFSLFKYGALQRGSSIFVNGCMGGVGRATVQIANSVGVRVDGSCNGGALDDAVRLGVERPVDYTSKNLSDYHGKYDAVLDTSATMTFRNAEPFFRSGSGVFLDLNPTSKKALSRLLNRRQKLVVSKPASDVLSCLLNMASIGVLDTNISHTVPLDDSIFAIADLERSSHGKGKVVITME